MIRRTWGDWLRMMATTWLGPLPRPVEFALRGEMIAALDRLIASGKIERALDENLEKTVGAVLSSELRQYSDFGKTLEALVKEAIKLDDKLGIPGYNDLVLKIVKQKLDAVADKAIRDGLDKQLSELLAMPPESVKLSKLVSDFIEYAENHKEHEREGSSDITLIVDDPKSYSTGGAVHRSIYLDPEGGKEKYDCAIKLDTMDGQVHSVRVDGKELKERLFIGSLYGFERSLFQFAAAGTKIEFDREAGHIDTAYPGDDN